MCRVGRTWSLRGWSSQHSAVQLWLRVVLGLRVSNRRRSIGGATVLQQAAAPAQTPEVQLALSSFHGEFKAEKEKLLLAFLLKEGRRGFGGGEERRVNFPPHGAEQRGLRAETRPGGRGSFSRLL
ncbi:hypothetical protein MHYP_G00285870 [Metynnis hypsauchen]